MTPRNDLVAYSRQVESALGVPPLVRSNGKGPFDIGWSQGPRAQPVQWRDKLRDWIGNVGIVTGRGLVVIDADLYVPGAEDAWIALGERGFTPNTVTCITGGGGRHYYFRWKGDPRVLSRALEGYSGIDVKADGGFVVVPPSVHPETGALYEWEFGWTPWDHRMTENQ